MRNDYDVSLVRFQDDTFTLNKQRALDICNGILEKGLDIKWVCDTRVDKIDVELLKRMKEAGCSRVKIGVESGSDEILRKMHKGVTQVQQFPLVVRRPKNRVFWSLCFVNF